MEKLRMFEIKNETRRQVLQKLKGLKILIIGRFDAPTDYLFDYLKEKARFVSVQRIRPERHKTVPLVSLTEYLRKRLAKKLTINHFLWVAQNKYLYVIFTLIVYLFLTIYLFFYFLMKGDFDIVVGVGPYNGWIATLYKLFNKSSKIVFYSEDRVDYEKDTTIGRLIKWCDAQTKKLSDAIWFVSDNHLKSYRQKEIVKKGLYVPEPVIKYWSYKKIKERKIVFLGGLSKEQGADMMYKVFKRLARTFSDIKLVTMGVGNLEDKLKIKTLKDRLQNKIVYMGFVIDRKNILDTISDSYVGLALYNPKIYKNLAYGQSSKISNYLGCGVPVITTGRGNNMPSLAKYIRQYKLGFVLGYKENEIFKHLKILLKNEKLYSEMKKNTIKFTKIFNKDRIYINAFAHLYGF